MSEFQVTTSRDGARSFRGGGNVNSYNQSSNRRGNRKKFTRGRGSSRGFGARGRGGVNPRSRLDEDGDVSMGSEVSPHSASRYNPYGARPPSRRGHRPSPGGGGGRLAMDNEQSSAMSRLGLPLSHRGGRGGDRGDNRQRRDQWFRVTIPHGEKFEKDFILKSINSISDRPFLPQKFHYDNKTAVFYVKDHSAANALRDVNKKITLPNGFKMVVIVKPCPPPELPLDDDAVEKIKVSMSKRYKVEEKFLDLSDFFNDEALNASGLRLALNKNANMDIVTKIIVENIPEVCGISLSNNRLTYLDTFSRLAGKTPGLVKLDLSKNQLRSEQLDKIREFKLVDLNLDGNQIRDRFKDQSVYVSFIRKKFPDVQKLDGTDLPPPITFEVESPTSLPPVKDSFFMNDSIRDLLVKFAQEFFKMYDSDDRQSLLAAYHNDAVFSLAIYFAKNVNKQANFAEYLPDSRNLQRLHGEKRFKVLKSGKVNVVSQLSLLPKTVHDLNSFKLDVTCSLPTLLSFTVSGIFKEPNNQRGPDCVHRHFSRTFIAVPAESGGILISNDQLNITNVSPEQAKAAFSVPAPTPSTSPVSGAAATAVNSPMDEPSEALKQEMIRQFAQQSGMNVSFSEQCLKQNEWSYENAAKAYFDLKSKGKIPEEAFV